MANIISLPIYKVNSSPFDFATGVNYRRDFALSVAGLTAQPVAHPHNVVNGAIIYSAIKHPAFGDAVLYSSKTTAEIVTAANA